MARFATIALRTSGLGGSMSVSIAAARRGCLMANSTCEPAAADPEVLAEAERTYSDTRDRRLPPGA